MNEHLFGVIEGSGVTRVDTFETVAGILIFVFNVALGIGISITLINIVYGFFSYVTSTGEPAAVKKAYNSVTWSVIGLSIALGSWAFKSIVIGMLGATLSDTPNF